MLSSWQEEQQELSEVFKVRIGLATSDRDQVDRLADEIDSAMTNGGQRRDDTMQRNRIDNYADRHFQEPDKPPVQFTSNRLRRPLLAKDNVAERRASRPLPLLLLIYIIIIIIIIVFISIVVLFMFRKKQPLLFSCITLRKVTNLNENFRQNS